ncbi:Pentatricopeptide repeat-containing protein [Platanthera guangdongensis]|uniref:Pentatricopeptide repeat-containing protein n=1 Tax=Platanthera guangdongensis TaxID=2320717 RepID=A0ABR2M9P6_9ASPA
MRCSTLILRQMEDKIIPQLTNCSCIKELKKIHAHILVSFLSQSNFLATRIINLCNFYRSIDYAFHVFKQVVDPNIFLYNAMIKAYTQNNHFLEAINLYKQMLRCSHSGDRFTYPFIIKCCGGEHIQLGNQIHIRVIKSGLDSNHVVQNSLIEIYTKVDDLKNAQKVFHSMTVRDAVSWNMLISGHARLGKLKEAMAIFVAMPNKTVVSWTVMISGYSMAGRYSDAVGVFRRMQIHDFEPDEVSIVSVIPACIQLGALELGKWIHAYADKHNLLIKPIICNALIELHCRCGSIDQALQLFDQMPRRDVISCSTMIWGLAMHGRSREAVQLFETMELEGRVRPNAVTFLGLFAACAHGGLLHEGLGYFRSMKEIYDIEPTVEHYGCIIDLLCRSGCINDAMEFIDDMPIPADAAIWGSLLSACRIHDNIEMAVKAMEQLLRLEPDDLGNYVLLSNIYASGKRWDDVSRIRRLMRNRRLKKDPGCSSIELNGAVHEFMAGDDSLLQSADMDDMLELLAMATTKIGTFSTLEDDEEIGSFDPHHFGDF